MQARIGAALALLAALGTHGAAQTSPRPAQLLLEPRYFAVWQAWDVAFPYAVRDAPRGRELIYYTGGGVDSLSGAAWDLRSIGAVVSTDGGRFEDLDDYAPVVQPGPYREGQVLDAPTLAARFDSVWAFGGAVLAEPDGFRMWYTGWAGQEAAGEDGVARPAGQRIGLATSADGLRFEKRAGEAGAGAVLAPGPGPGDALGVGQPAVLGDTGSYRMWYEGYDGRTWRIFHASSPDGVTWTKHGLTLGPGEAGSPDEAGLRNPVVLRRRGRLELWYQGLSGSKRPVSRVLRAVSEDGASWRKLDGEVSLHAGAPLAEGEETHVDSVLVLPDGRCRVFFARQTTLDLSLGEDLGRVRRPTFRIYAETLDP